MYAHVLTISHLYHHPIHYPFNNIQDNKYHYTPLSFPHRSLLPYNLPCYATGILDINRAMSLWPSLEGISEYVRVVDKGRGGSGVWEQVVRGPWHRWGKKGDGGGVTLAELPTVGQEGCDPATSHIERRLFSDRVSSGPDKTDHSNSPLRPVHSRTPADRLTRPTRTESPSDCRRVSNTARCYKRALTQTVCDSAMQSHARTYSHIKYSYSGLNAQTCISL